MRKNKLFQLQGQFSMGQQSPRARARARLCMRLSVSSVHSPRRRLVVVRGAVCCVGGTFWSVGGKPTGADSLTVVRRQPTAPPWADPSSECGQTSL